MAISFSCPKCGKMLRTSTQLAPGRKVKCPGCSTLFAPALDDEEVMTAVSSKPSLKAPARKSARPMDDDDDRPRRRPSRDMDDEDDRPRKRAARSEDDDYDDDERGRRRSRDDDDDYDDEDRPRRRKQKSGSKLPLILGLSGVAVLLIAFAVTAFVWPGFLKGGGAGGGGGAANLLAFLPSNCDVVGGMNMKVIHDNPTLRKQFEQLVTKGSRPDDEFTRIFLSADSFVAAHNTDSQGKDTKLLVVSNSKGFDIPKLQQSLKAGEPETIDGIKVYRCTKIGGPNFFALPVAKTLVIGEIAQSDFVQMCKGTGQFQGDLQALVGEVKNSAAWIAAINNANFKKQLQGQLSRLPVPGAAQAEQAFLRATTISCSVEYGTSAKAQASIQCANEADATQVDTFVKGAWNIVAPQLDMLPLLLGGQNDLLPAINDIKGTFKVERAGSKVTANAALSEKTVAALAKAGEKGPPGKDFVPKDFMPKDIMPKDMFPKDGFPKDMFKDMGKFKDMMKDKTKDMFKDFNPGGGFPKDFNPGGGFPKDGFKDMNKFKDMMKDMFKDFNPGGGFPKDMFKDKNPFPKDFNPGGGFPKDFNPGGGFPKDAFKDMNKFKDMMKDVFKDFNPGGGFPKDFNPGGGFPKDMFKDKIPFPKDFNPGGGFPKDRPGGGVNPGFPNPGFPNPGGFNPGGGIQPVPPIGANPPPEIVAPPGVFPPGGLPVPQPPVLQPPAKK